MSPERPIPKDPTIANKERAQRLAQSTHLVAPNGATPLFELEDFTEEPPQAEARTKTVEHSGRPRLNATQWLEQNLGETWWKALGIEDDTPPSTLTLARTLLSILTSSNDVAGAITIIEGWIDGLHPRDIADSDDAIAGENYVNNTLNKLKHKISKLTGIKPSEHMQRKGRMEAGADRGPVGAIARDWLIDVYGAQWWKRFGFESEKTVVVQTLVNELIVRLQVISVDDNLREQLTEWFNGKSVNAIARNRSHSEKVRQALRDVKDELRDMESFARAQQRQAAERRIPSPVGVRSVASSVNVDATNEVRKVSLAGQWAERLGLNEQMSKDLARYMNPNGSSIIDRDMYQAVRHLTEYIQSHYGSLRNHQFELTEDQADMLSEILGIDRNERTKRPGMPSYQTVSRFVRDFPQRIYGYTSEEERVIQVLGGFRKILDEDTARLARIQQG